MEQVDGIDALEPDLGVKIEATGRESARADDL